MEEILDNCTEEEFVSNNTELIEGIVEDSEAIVEDIIFQEVKHDLEDDTISLDYDTSSNTCKKCSQDFASTDELLIHMETCKKNVNNKVFSCPKCFKNFKYEDTFHVHFANCTSHECSICNKRFTTKGFLRVSFTLRLLYQVSR